MADPRPLTRKELARFLPDQRSIRAFEKLFDLIPSDLLTLIELISSVGNETHGARSAINVIKARMNRESVSNRGLVYVTWLSDLPQAVAGVITLKEETTYFFTSNIDLEGSRIVCSQDTVILGFSSENSSIKSTGLTGAALITSVYTLPIRNIAFEAETIFDLNAGASDQALDWQSVNLLNTTNIGTIQNYNNFVASSMAFLSASGLVFDGTVGTVAFTDCIFVGTTVNASITLSPTLTINRRFRIAYSAIITQAGGTGIDADVLATIPNEGYIFDTCNFAGGGTAISGVPYTDNKARFIENRGITNTGATSGYYMVGNATVTTIATVGTPVLIAGTTTETTITQRFTVSTSNRATYIGSLTRDFSIQGTFSLTSSNNNQVTTYIYKNGSVLIESTSISTTNSGGRLEGGAIQCLVQLEENDYIEVWVENNTGANDITVEDLNLIIQALN